MPGRSQQRLDGFFLSDKKITTSAADLRGPDQVNRCSSRLGLFAARMLGETYYVTLSILVKFLINFLFIKSFIETFSISFA